MSFYVLTFYGSFYVPKTFGRNCPKLQYWYLSHCYNKMPPKRKGLAWFMVPGDMVLKQLVTVGMSTAKMQGTVNAGT